MNRFQFNFINEMIDLMLDYNLSNDVREFIACQFALESAFGTSVLATENHNICGMKNPIVRISTSIVAGDGTIKWAKYDTYSQCIADYFLCIQYYRPISTQYDTIEHYAQFIRKFYCPEGDYIDKINKIYKQFKSYQNEQTK